MGVLLMALTLFGGAAAVYFMSKAWNRHEYAQATRIGQVLFTWLGLYILALVGVSLFTPAKEAGGGEVRFCGIDPDCDLYATIVQVGYTRNLGNPPRELIAQNTYYLITVKVGSQSVKPNLKPDLTGTVVDASGREYPSSPDAEKVVRQQHADSGRAATPSGTWRKTLVFDLPENIDRPALTLREGSVFERLLDLFIIGDEASLLHPKTKLRFLNVEDQRKL